MGRRRRNRGIPINGWLAIYKEPGLTSRQVVERVQRTTQAAKAGHGGTLDPFAEGVLPIALGEATKTTGMVLEGDKGYRCWVSFGRATDTGDPTGEVIAEDGKIPSQAALEEILPQFTGEISQIPPKYSALRVDGERAYKKARRGEEVKIDPRQVTIHQLELVSFEQEIAVLDVKCSKGTYIRTLASDIAEAVGCKAHLIRLLRQHTLGFDADSAVTLESLRSHVEAQKLNEVLHPVDRVLDDIPALRLTPDAWYHLKQGQVVTVEQGQAIQTYQGTVRVQNPAGHFGALGELLAADPDHPNSRLVKPVRLFHLEEDSPGAV
uniref:tRNA pseudouridine synthase B n=1 Tax=Magnetococcus massalia (strain MO-1) TaxID=451514 RepID=A0A1S7LLA8_MAGMO|nr:tRNA pseudouridine synthase B (tRNA pseudouridine 55 synthase) (Psi55 synthase) (tRNA-uridine isomerase) (tRNA pseudouridylate synthase) [Candidatus Magnetococcus massalia]